jgi:hypothetical protein
MPNRIIKESIRTSRSVNGLSDFCFRLWIYLITYVDDFGRGSADPELIKGLVFPRRKGVTESQIKDALERLASAGMIILYKVDGESFLYFPNWSEHQRIRNSIAKYPEPVRGDSPQLAATRRDSRPEYNPIQSNTESESESKSIRADADPKDEAFKVFYAAYPRKIDPKRARASWDRIKPDADLIEKIMQGLEAWKASDSWSDPQFIPHPTTWLNNRRWEAAPEPKKRRDYGFGNYTQKVVHMDDLDNTIDAIMEESHEEGHNTERQDH